jgi:uncharacterized phiE125 gp8 family phage protein
MYATLQSAPSTAPVSLAEAKSHLRVEVADDDTLIQSYIDAATVMAEEFLRRRLITQTWRIFLDGFPQGNGAIVVPYSPLVSISGFSYKDPTTGADTPVSGSVYSVEAPNGPNPARGRIVLGFDQQWPTPRDQANAVQFDAVVGYGAASSVPAAIRSAILLLVGNLYANRESVVTGISASKLPMSAEFLLSPFRLFEFQ